jgi:hypothetical protein
MGDLNHEGAQKAQKNGRWRGVNHRGPSAAKPLEPQNIEGVKLVEKARK